MNVLAQLAGSEKQIAWAEAIRATCIESAEWLARYYAADERQAGANKALATAEFLKTVPEARFFIDELGHIPGKIESAQRQAQHPQLDEQQREQIVADGWRSAGLSVLNKGAADNYQYWAQVRK